jgi:Transposase and inactivated derivatives
MEAVYERCCGIDVHKKKIVACLSVGGKQEIRNYGTSTKDLKEMAQWLMDNGCQISAMESTGAYWKPVYNVLELLGLEVIIVNAQHMKAVPGRKTDTKDAVWIADLLKHGLLKASFIPDKEQRELREISRYRKSLVEERSREINRLEKTLEGANIKLSSVVSSLNGLSSRGILNALMGEGLNENNIDSLLYGALKEKRAELLTACDGVMTKIQKKLVRAILDHIDDMTKRISEMDDIINGEMKAYEQAIKALDEMPGIAPRSAQIILSEIGLDMTRFPTAAHLASWAGLSPGNNESAGKRKSGRTCKGNKTLKSTMIQCAKTAAHKKGSFYNAQFERLVVRRGKNRATVAVAHSMLISIYHMLKDDVPFCDLGSDYYNQFNTEKKIDHCLKLLKSFGYQLPTPVLA